MKTYFIKTFGCQMNHSDSEKIETILENISLQKSQTLEEADLVIFNTCSIKQHAEDRVMGFVHNAYKRGQKVAVTGCMIKKTSLQVSPEEREKYLALTSSKEKNAFKKKLKEERDPLVLGNKRISLVFRIEDVQELPEMLKSFDESLSRPKVEFNELDYLNIQPKLQEDFRAFVPIMTGCDKFCTYCIVPFTRGKERSRKFLDIITECQNHVQNGVKEITLVGQNVNAYFLDDSTRKTLQRQTDFAFLLEEVAKIPGLERIKFTSPHPRHMGDDVLEVMAKYDNIAKTIHLPVQSGSSKVLQRMGREHNIGRFKEITQKARELMPEITITTDIIVGFCGETAQDFEKTIELFEEEKFVMAFISKYSPRKGTVSAEKMQDDVADNEKKRRLKVLTEKLAQILREESQKRIGQVENILIEKIQDTTAEGRSEFGRVCRFTIHSRKNLGEIVPVKFTSATEWAFEGEEV
jgi:tRNA-2-methylthio-N6-dimethylallyladenosine synthase